MSVDYTNKDWLCLHGRINHSCPQCWNGGRQTEPDPTTAALDALRSAVVAQTALLRSLSEQVRLGFEDKTLKGSMDGFLQATAVWFEKTWKQQAGLAERLEKLEPSKELEELRQ